MYSYLLLCACTTNNYTISPFSQPVTHPVDKDSDYFPIPSNFLRPDPEMIAKQHEMYQEMLSQRLPDTPQEDEIIQRSIMARRDQLKQVLNNARTYVSMVSWHIVVVFLWSRVKVKEEVSLERLKSSNV